MFEAWECQPLKPINELQTQYNLVPQNKDNEKNLGQPVCECQGIYKVA